MRMFRKLKVPVSAHPLVRKLYERMNHQQIGVMDMAERSGVNKNTFKEWRTRTIPRIADLEACYNVLGLELKPVRRKEDLSI